MSTGNIPVLFVKGKTLPEVWERAVIETWERGIEIQTEYDKEGDEASRDVTMLMEVERPFQEPRIHRSFPAGLEELEIYRQEVIYGVHDSWIKPEDKKWSYTYHQRLFNYDVIDDFADSNRGGPFQPVNQVEQIINDLIDCYYTRRAQAITWMPTVDAAHPEPPCLQRVWVRMCESPDGNYILNMNTHWRSRDAYKAAFMNMYALTDIQRVIAEELSARTSRKIQVGRYVDISDSFHIYGAYFSEFEENFLKLRAKREFEERVWSTKDTEYFLINGRIQLLNGKPGEPELTDEHKKRIFLQIPDKYKEMLKQDVREKIKKLL